MRTNGDVWRKMDNGSMARAVAMAPWCGMGLCPHEMDCEQCAKRYFDKRAEGETGPPQAACTCEGSGVIRGEELRLAAYAPEREDER